MGKSSLNIQVPLNEKKKLQLQLSECARNYNISLDLLEKASDDQKLLDAILDEYIFRLNELDGADLKTLRSTNTISEQQEKFKSLIMFATQAAKLHEQSKLFNELDKKNKELKYLNNELDKKNCQLISLNEHYLNMLSFASHELRSPLISILGYAELLSDGILGELKSEQSEAVDIIIRVSKNLLEMIKNYLDLTKIETGQLSLKINRIMSDIQSDVVDAVLYEMREQFSKKKMRAVALKTEPGFLNIDRDLMRIVFTNLFSNAVKYGRDGTDVCYSITQDSEHCLITIKNSGVGVKSEKIATIFNKFTQAVESQQIDVPKGTGLGLFIAKTIVQEHGGTIWAESEYGNWFKVLFTIPVPKKQSIYVNKNLHNQDGKHKLSVTSEENGNGQSKNTHH